MHPHGVILYARNATPVFVFPVPRGPYIMDIEDPSSSEGGLVQLFQALGIP